ncbi:hypothetical protein AJ80_07410 [Polytolypa hystricis UAMH7299]|uniref:Uncharacterized protein n=1 Tax=Polytolypa hystricis (strain UAMH7299) TaxID=1447883 RepID=A0A2B7XPA0_POLH7|nr:hypothetical protein AJ80_07410 [Polytolypa hystricis UAMH7299]
MKFTISATLLLAGLALARPLAQSPDFEDLDLDVDVDVALKRDVPVVGDLIQGLGVNGVPGLDAAGGQKLPVVGRAPIDVDVDTETDLESSDLDVNVLKRDVPIVGEVSDIGGVPVGGVPDVGELSDLGEVPVVGKLPLARSVDGASTAADGELKVDNSGLDAAGKVDAAGQKLPVRSVGDVDVELVVAASGLDARSGVR